jgi:hypothetical protein
MNAMRNITIIYPALCEKIITFRLTFLLPEILSLRFFEPQQERLRVDCLDSDRPFPFRKCHHNAKTISSPEGKNREGELNRHRVRSGFVLHTSISNCMLGISFIFALPQLQIEA